MTHALQAAAYEETLRCVQADDDASSLSPSVVRQWMLCVQDTLALLSHTVDLTAICRYLPDTTTTATNVRDAGDTKNASRQRLLQTACRRQVVLHGGEPFRLRYQRCVRWTWLLTFYYCTHSGSDHSRHDAVMRMYESCVLPLAHQMLPRQALQHVYHCMRRRERHVPCAQLTSSSSLAASDVPPVGSYSQRVQPMLYAAISEVTGAAATCDMARVACTEEQVAQLRRCVSARLQAMAHGRDVDEGKERRYSAIDGAQVPSTPLRALVRAVLGNAEPVSDMRQEMNNDDTSAVKAPTLTAADRRAVSRTLETVGYIVLTRVSFGQCARDCDVLPFLVDFAALMERCQDGVSNDSDMAADGPASTLLETLYGALLAALRMQYARTMAEVIHGAVTEVTMSQTSLHQPSASPSLPVSPVMLEVLTRIVEPTLRLCPRGKAVSRDVRRVLQEALADVVPKAAGALRSKHTASSSSSLDAHSLHVLRDYLAWSTKSAT